MAVASTTTGLLAELEAQARARMPKCVAMQERGQAVMPGGASGDGKTWWPLYLSGARGSTLRDLDGNEYIDLVLGIGPNLLGHGDPSVVAAVRDSLEIGGAVAAGTALEVELAERITSMIPAMERVRFVSTGSEATMMAIRAARAATGKPRIAKFEGHYHGQHDEVLVSAFGGVSGEADSPTAHLDCHGLMPEVERDAIVLPWNNLEAVERILSDHADEIAAVICEPVPCVPLGGTPPQEGLLHALRELTQRIGALLIFDEVVTGLRMREGSASAHFGITPDLITLGKVAGGGLPIGVYGGAASIMELVVGPGADPERKIFQSGTFSGSPVVMAAGIALIDRLSDGSAHECADAQAERLRDGLRDAAASVDLAVQVTGMSSWFGVYFTENPIRSRRDILTSDPVMERALSVGLLGRGVFLKPGHPGFTSAAHTSTDIDHVLEHAAELLGLIARCGQR